MRTVVALGGNALTRPGERGTTEEQRANVRAACAAIAPVVADDELVITHGNGPQVGQALVRQERAADEVPALPLYLAVAQTQAEIGTLIAAELAPLAGRRVACLVTHVVVDQHDEAFRNPTKPIGPVYGEAKARRLEHERGWSVADDAGRGWRRVVASPVPLEVIELDAVRMLVAAGSIAVACGGGGIPVARRNGRLEGVDAVIDKDRASALLAVGLDAGRLLILTDVPALVRGFDTPEADEVRELTLTEAAALAPELAAGSMRPKVEAAAEFVRATGGEALITCAALLESALAGRAGTRLAR